jgi:ATP-dependent RNA helicase HelY
VVLERLVKYNGEQHMPLTPGEYTQLTGRAGRRGIDVEGHAVVLWNPDIDPAEVAGLASTRTFPLRSSFAPTYNMTINLVNQMGPAQAHKLLERSFAQYQADRSVVGLVRGVERGERMLGELADGLGGVDAPILDYVRLRAQIAERERAQSRASRLQRRHATNTALSALRRGDIITITHGRHGGLAVVLEPAREEDDPRPLVLSEHRWAGRISSADYSGGAGPIGKMALPKRVEHRNPRARRDLASALRSAAADLDVPSARGRRSGPPPDPDIDPELAVLRARMRAHRAHALPDREEQARTAERYLRMERDNEQLRGKISAATNSLAQTFDRIVVLLTERGFIAHDGVDETANPAVTDDGRLLARIYSESDLLVAECLRAGIWEQLDAAELAAALSTVLYESRRDGYAPGDGSDIPTGRLRRALNQTRRLWTELRADEQRHRVTQSREPDGGFVAAIYRWASTGDLASALAASDTAGSGAAMSAGDFVRWCRQVLDLADQVRSAAPSPTLRATAKRAINDVRRGVVAVDAG